MIEQRFRGPLSLSDVAEAVHLTPGHLTTAVRRRTGRTVQDWIVERGMTEARRLLVETDLGVAEVGRRVGYPDPGYFSRVFRRAHEQTPRAWRTRPRRDTGEANQLKGDACKGSLLARVTDFGSFEMI